MDYRARKPRLAGRPPNPRLAALQLDPEDEWLRLVSCPAAKGYASTTFKPQTLLHRFIMRAPKGWDVDHINGDRLDNRKENLRAVTRARNLHNIASTPHGSAAYIGVVPSPTPGKWVAQMSVNGRPLYLGTYLSPEAANYARLLKEKEVRGIQPRRLTAFQAAGIRVSPI